MTTWRVLDCEQGDAEPLLARGLALLDGLADDPRPALRWYRATTPALVIGRGQLTNSGSSPDSRRSARVSVVVRRGTGGGAVLMDEHLLCGDVLLPAGHPWLGGDLAAVFDPVGEAWTRALAGLGVADLAVHRGAGTARRRGSDRDRLLAAICYATVGRGEVLAGGRKLLGLAQRRRRQGALIQCGLLRRWHPGPLLAALGADPEDAEIAETAVGLDDLLPDPPSDETVMAAVTARLTC